MKRFVLCIFLLSLCSVAFPKVVWIKLNQTPVLAKSNKNSPTGVQTVDRILQKHMPEKIESLLPDMAGLSESLQKWRKVVLPDHADVETFIAECRQNSAITDVHINQVFRIHQRVDDELYSRQWALQIIQAESAWAIERGKNDILIAVIDTGVDYEHPDLWQNVWINPAEDLNNNGRFDPEDINHIDEDGNGFIDDIVGWDFTDAPDHPTGGDYLDRDNDPMDEHNHGTAVSGIISATSDNGIGISGLAPGCRVMAIKSFTPAGYGEEDDSAAAILYAVQQGARVINMSWGEKYITPLLEDVIQYAFERGVVMVASSGNSGNDQIHYPSALSTTISVGASNSKDIRASFSNYGPTVDLLAPGQDIHTTLIDSEYDSTLRGTSFSAPFVSAAAGLILSQDPELSPDAVKGILVGSVTDLEPQGWDIYNGSGRLNIHRALERNRQAITEITFPTFDQGVQNEIEIRGTAWSPTMKSYQLFYGEGANPEKWNPIGEPRNRMVIDDVLDLWENIPEKEGEYLLRLTMINNDGSESWSSVRVFVDHSAPQISGVKFNPMIDGAQRSTLIGFNTDDLCVGRILYRPVGSNKEFSILNMPYRASELYLNVSQNDLLGEFECILQAENSIGRVAEDDNQGNYYVLNLDQAPVNRVKYSPLSYQLPAGYWLDRTSDLNGNGFPELIINATDERGNAGPVRFYEFDGLDFIERTSSPTKLIPRDVYKDPASDKTLFLGGYGVNSYLYASLPNDPFHLIEEKIWLGDSVKGYWASRLTDMDQDGAYEIIMKISDYASSVSHELFKVFESDGAGGFNAVAELPNPTRGQNRYGVPHSIIGDFDHDGLLEILLGDEDGDVFIYEAIANNTWTLSWQDSLPLMDAISYSQAGDFDGDGTLEFIVGCHSNTDDFNSEFEYDNRHWFFRIYKATQDNHYDSVFEQRFYGAESARDFASGVSSGDLDNDGKDEILLSLFPDFYCLEHEQENQFEFTYYRHPAQSDAILVTDSDGDGANEFWLSDGNAARAFTMVGSETAPTVPAGLTARPLGPDRIVIDWFEVPGADEYEIFRSLGDEKSLASYMTLTSPPFTDIRVVADSNYFYSIRAIDRDRSPAFSLLANSVQARPGERPFLVKAGMASKRHVLLTFSEPVHKISSLEQFEASPDLGELSSFSMAAGGRDILLAFAHPFVKPGTYSIRVSDIVDLDNVPLDTLRNRAEFEITLLPSPPYVVEGKFLNDQKIEILFSEPMDMETLLDARHYNMNEHVTISHVASVAGDNTRVRLSLHAPHGFGALGKNYRLTVTDVKSTNGVAIRHGRGNVIDLIFSKNDLTEAFTYPNPYRAGMGEEKIVFANLTKEAEIKILSLQGHLIKTIYENDGDGGAEWNVRDENGKELASGIYLYYIRSKDDTFMGKLAIIR